jgi:hypothetical protein
VAIPADVTNTVVSVSGDEMPESVTIGLGQGEAGVSLGAYEPKVSEDVYNTLAHGAYRPLDLYEGLVYEFDTSLCTTGVFISPSAAGNERFRPSTLFPPQNDALLLYDGSQVTSASSSAGGSITFTVPPGLAGQILYYKTEGGPAGELRVYAGAVSKDVWRFPEPVGASHPRVPGRTTPGLQEGLPTR